MKNESCIIYLRIITLTALFQYQTGWSIRFAWKDCFIHQISHILSFNNSSTFHKYGCFSGLKCQKLSSNASLLDLVPLTPYDVESTVTNLGVKIKADQLHFQSWPQGCYVGWFAIHIFKNHDLTHFYSLAFKPAWELFSAFF